MKSVINGAMKNTTKRKNLFTENGEPRRIKCYMTKRPDFRNKIEKMVIVLKNEG